MSSNNNNATRELLAEIARLREDIRAQGIMLLDIEMLLQFVSGHLHLNRDNYRCNVRRPLPPAED